MSSVPAQPRLRLVGAHDSDARADWARSRRVRQEVIRENRKAAGNPALAPTDPRWVLAVRAYGQLQGTAMTPERRQRVMRTAEHLGVRPFDASVIIAVVQDHARRGETLGDAAPTLALLHKPEPPRAARRSWHWLRWIAAIGAAIIANGLLMLWILSG
jgi:hypothetical protein